MIVQSGFWFTDIR